MIGYLDHEDVAKTRKALLVVSALTFMMAYVEIDRQSMLEIFGLKVHVSKEKILAMLSISVLYFSYMFLARTLSEVGIRYLKTFEKLREIRRERLNLQEMRALDRDDLPAVQDLTWLESRASRALPLIEALSYVATETFPPFIFAGLALVKSDGIEAIVNLMSSAQSKLDVGPTSPVQWLTHWLTTLANQ